MYPTLPFDLLSRMARREAGALTLIPDRRVRTDRPEPEILFAFVPCRWCAAAGPALPPLRETAVVERPSRTRGLTMPVLTLLRCEELTARSLLPLSLIRTAPGAPQPRISTRAAYWSRHVPADWASPEAMDLGLELLDARERWLDAFQPGAVPWTCDEEVVLPASARAAARPGVRERPTAEVAASRRSLHFLTPHAAGGYAARLNDAYLFARITAVRAALSTRDHAAYAV
ncbi:hypothetical protein ACIBEJ_02690 [Nonomuraea sp. NPDC050790]|uniref:hypothetical protein n=1 Tax=Nonomuraea sp. NPDC050790 TaxID=3364371 RepID=UPI003799295E